MANRGPAGLTNAHANGGYERGRRRCGTRALTCKWLQARQDMRAAALGGERTLESPGRSACDALFLVAFTTARRWLIVCTFWGKVRINVQAIPSEVALSRTMPWEADCLPWTFMRTFWRKVRPVFPPGPEKYA